MKISALLQQNLLGKLANHSVVFLINILIVRMSGASISGSYFNELYLINFFVFIFSAGLDYAAIAWIARQPDLSSLVHEKLIRISLFFMLVMMMITWFALPLFKLQIIQTPTAIFFFAAGNLLLILFQGMMSAQKRFNWQNIILISTNSLFLILLLFLFNMHHPDKIKWIFNGYAWLFFLQGMLMLLFSNKKGQRVEAQINWRKFYRHGIYIMISSVVYFCFLRADNFFVEKYANKISLSNYVQCGKIGQYFLYFSSIISSTLLPFIISDNIASDYQAWKKMVKPYITLICIGAILLLIIGPWVYPWIFGAEFAQMQGFMQLLMPGYVCLGLLTLVNAIYIGKGNIQKIFKGDLAGLMILLLADTILVPLFGPMAAAAVSSVAYCLVFLYLWSDLKNQFQS